MSSSSSESDDESDVNSRKWIKGIRNPELYKRNIIRNYKVSGKKHTNWKVKIVVKRTGNLCSENGAETNVDNKQKFSTYKYFLVIDNTRIDICKKTFIAVYGVTERRVYRICNLLRHDKRGENRSGNAMSAEVLLRIHEHIKSYPTHISHYSGKEKKYLDAILYEMSQVDTCAVCEELGVEIKSPSINDNAKRAYPAELMVHKRRAKKFYNKIRSVQELCKSRDDVVDLCFDFMSNLPLPPVKEIFYFHQLDNCDGQNKNHTVPRFLAALTDSGRFDKIHYCLPLRGHSFLPCNRDFGRVKRVIRKADRIFSPDEYAQMIKQACKRADKFTVTIVNTNDIFDIKTWWTEQ
ncbi:hypothetical protein ILUMI_19014 [Ignelater luminosus]|uniref:DUF7869 domain-containing protein n=1 Tax=Ignelater luminosus TaxID=2038154 RepID=A0A8K0G5V0_IGNLU|nr:hypothetical protein ILUMI_19014 [Ignelater luminosus]